MNETYTYAVGAEDTGKRIDLFLTAELDQLSRSRIQKLIEQGMVSVNRECAKQNYKLRQGDIVEISVPPAQALEILPENIELDILYEDKDLVVINKPKDMVVHPAPGHYSGTLVNALLHHCGHELLGIGGVLRPGIVHRIDKDTSGVLVVAKSDIAHSGLAEQFALHTVTRKYYAVVFNNIIGENGIVDKPIGRHQTDRKKMTVTEKNGRRAVTHYRVLERFGRYTLIENTLETGRTHQIRVHMSYIGHPLVGDTVYSLSKQFTNLNGQALHAKVLGFVHPTIGAYMEFDTELPSYFVRLLDNLRG